jgi:hypothetical protein
MFLEPGRVEKMVMEATANESCITCHESDLQPEQIR